MRSFLLTFAGVIIFISCLSFASLIQASGNLTTSQDDGAGQTRLINRNGIIYLTTDVNPSTDSTQDSTSLEASSSAATASGRRINLYPPNYAQSASQIIRAVLNLILIIAVLLVFFFIISAAFDWLTSGGDKGKTEKARQKIIAAVIGIIIIISSYALLQVVAHFVGFDTGSGVELRIPTIQQFNQTATPSATPVLTSPTPTPATQ